MFQGPSNLIRKRYDKLLDYENSANRLGSLRDGDITISTVSSITGIHHAWCTPGRASGLQKIEL